MEILRDVLADAPGHRLWMSGAARRAPPHSVLLEVQDPGLGRALVETWLATLYCGAPGEGGAPCGECSDCRQLAAGAHMGVVHLEPDGNTIRVDQVRELVLSRLGERVPGGRHQVFVVHGAEALGDESGNALLKVVEEPPPSTVFLLLTEDRQAVLGTIRSRSQELVVPRPDLEDLLGRLGVDPAGGAAALLAAGLSPGVVKELQEQGAPAPEEVPLGELAAGIFAELEDGEVLRDPRAAGHRARAATGLFDAAAGMLARPDAWAAHARACHDYADAAGKAAKGRAKEIRRRMTEAHGSGWEHPTLKREVAFARMATTRAGEDLLRALAAVLASALRVRSGREPFGLAARAAGVGALAGRPSAELLGLALRVRRAREPLRRNQNLRLLFEELFLDLAALAPPREVRRG